MRAIARVLLHAAFLATSPTWAAAPYTVKCPEADRNVLAVQYGRSAVAQRCDCAGAASSREYVRCTKREASALERVARLTRACRRVVVDFERRGLCGRPTAAVCCRPTRKGRAKSAVTGAGRCAARGGTACGCEQATAGVCAHSAWDACTPDATCVAAADGGGPAVVHSHLLPSTALLLGWIEDIVAQGIRRPGYPADDWTAQWAADRFADVGLEDIRLDPIDVLRWEARACALAIWPSGRPAERHDIPCFPVPYATPTGGLTGALAPFAAVSTRRLAEGLPPATRSRSTVEGEKPPPAA
jgi:hypothetical protein